MLGRSTGYASSGCCYGDRRALKVSLLYKKNQKKGGLARASPVAAPMPKLVSFFREKRGCLDCLVLA